MEKNCFKKKGLMAAIAVGAAFVLPSVASATVSGQCANCHTMHNSQDGLAMNVDPADGVTPVDTVYRALTKGNCIGCHAGVNGDGKNIPYVLLPGTTSPTYSIPSFGGAAVATLAGGNFWWVNDGDDATGHNVTTLPGGNLETDNVTGTPGVEASPPYNVPGVQEITCAGTMGCHGVRTESDEFKAISGGHHGVPTDTSTGYVPGTAGVMADSYRMLDGIRGIEDSDWEMTVAAGNHNYYYGVARNGSADSTETTSTISSLCGQCHGNFHTSATAHLNAGDDTEYGISYLNDMTGPWVRHPTDFDMSALPTSSEYSGYTTYNMESPVAASDLAASYAVADSAFDGGAGSASGHAIVVCVSCHRAHGSPYADLLRWDYAEMTVGNTGAGGCFNCHTTKDD